ncbi:uncharacterized protein LOC134819345 [Bolinopsis microptera]|uniref:uncharacterized protein LOC134819345 n=1 Tax=Bolinopsis microptera TaxID=2820187 RepID=UPI00307947F9
MEVGEGTILSLDSSGQQDIDDYFVFNSDFVAQAPNQITCLQEDKVQLIKKVNDDWWLIRTTLGAQGQVPAKQLDFYFEPAEPEKQPGPSNGAFKRTASKIFQRTNSVRGIKVSTSAIKNSTNKLKGQFTPKRKTTKIGADSPSNIPPETEKSRGWGFVKNKILGDSKKKGVTKNTEQESNQNEEKTTAQPAVPDVKVVNSTPNKPPRRNKLLSADSHTTQGSHVTVASQGTTGSRGTAISVMRLTTEGNKEESPESESTPKITPRSGDLSLNESCVWDSFAEMQEYHNVQPVDNQKENMASPIDEDGDDVAMVVQAEMERQSIERQSSTDTSNLESGSEVAIDTLPDPPAPGTFSPARVLVSSSSPFVPHTSSYGLAALSPTHAGSTLTVVQDLTPNCSTEDLLAIPTSESEPQSMLTENELQDILSPKHHNIPPPSSSTPQRQKTAARSLQYEEEGEDLRGVPDPPTTQITPTKRHKPCKRAPSTMSNMSILSDMSSAPSEAPSFSGTKSGIHYFSPPPERKDAGSESDAGSVLDTPRIQRIIKSDPVYTQIVDDSAGKP